jgi:uncharacterized protein (UPF0333 family)
MIKYKKQKAQTTLEFIIIIVFIIMFVFYFTSMIFNTSQVNKSVNAVKNKTLELLSRNESNSYIQSVQYNLSSTDLNFKIYIIREDDYDFNISKFDPILDNIKKTTKFENVNLDIEYI